MGASGPVEVGRLTRHGVLFGYLALDTQEWFSSQRIGLIKRRRWKEFKRRCRLAIYPFGPDDWDESFLEADDDLENGRFVFKGEALVYEELVGAEREEVYSQWFAQWE